MSEPIKEAVEAADELTRKYPGVMYVVPAESLVSIIQSAIEKATEATAEHFRQGIYGKLDKAINLIEAAQRQRSEPSIDLAPQSLLDREAEEREQPIR